MKRRMLIRGGKVLDPVSGTEKIQDVLITGDRIEAVGDGPGQADVEVSAEGLLVAPGLIDAHVHLREPGGEHKETIASGTAAAVAGGFTAVCCMPNTAPPLDTPDVLRDLLRRARETGRCRVYPIACLSKHRAGRELVDFAALVEAGAVAFSDDGDGLADDHAMDRAFQILADLDRVAAQHCEDPTFPRGVMHEGAVSRTLNCPGISPLAEERMLERDLQLARQHNARYHVAHISTARSVALVRAAKQQGLRVTAEVSPHHLLLTDEDCRSLDPNFKMHPPLRTQQDVQACIAGVVDGTIDILATDHAPHSPAEKAAGFMKAPPGIVGLETALPLLARALVEPGQLNWCRLVRMLSTVPARIFGLPGGALHKGAVADLTLIDPQQTWTIDAGRFHSKSRNSPFDGWRVQGQVVCTIVGGVMKYDRGRVL